MVRLVSPVITLLISSASALKVSEKAQARSKFMSVMNKVAEEHGLERRGSQEKLTKAILSKSKPSDSNLRKNRKLEDASVTDDAAAAATDDASVTDDAVAATDDISAAAVEEEAEYYVAEETTDDASVEVDDQYDNAHIQDDEVDYSDIFFDFKQFSIKFHSCASVAIDFEDFDKEEDDNQNQQKENYYQYYGEEAEEEDNNGIVYPYTTTQVVNYRLCPTDTCQDNSWKGCRNTYGNYMISLEDYFQAQEQYIEEVFEQYCDYCAQCQYMYKVCCFILFFLLIFFCFANLFVH